MRYKFAHFHTQNKNEKIIADFLKITNLPKSTTFQLCSSNVIFFSSINHRNVRRRVKAKRNRHRIDLRDKLTRKRRIGSVWKFVATRFTHSNIFLAFRHGGNREAGAGRRRNLLRLRVRSMRSRGCLQESGGGQGGSGEGEQSCWPINHKSAINDSQRERMIKKWLQYE